MYSEKRKHPRTPKDFRISIRRAAGLRDEGEPVAAQLVDVSLGGIGFTTPEALRKDARLRVHIDVETIGQSSTYVVHITSWAVVRWTRKRADPDEGYLIGAEFVDTSRAETQLWQGFFQKWSDRYF